ncbi:MAG: folate family ECF transporter S component [Oscillospiraceae bacterium]|nr:folate family ECF transporter S component [Oscillospiraceae bacterium]
MKKYELRYLILAGLFVALDIICTRFLPAYFLPPGTFLVRVGLQALIFALAGWTIGPGWAMGMGMASDVVGVLINPTGTGQFFPGYTLTAGLSGLMYGLILYKRKPHLLRVVLAAAAHMLLIALPLTSLWFMMQGYYPSFWSSFWLALPYRAALILPYSLLIFGLQKVLANPVKKL